jgi:hypothetical protein
VTFSLSASIRSQHLPTALRDLLLVPVISLSGEDSELPQNFVLLNVPVSQSTVAPSIYIYIQASTCSPALAIFLDISTVEDEMRTVCCLKMLELNIPSHMSHQKRMDTSTTPVQKPNNSHATMLFFCFKSNSASLLCDNTVYNNVKKCQAIIQDLQNVQGGSNMTGTICV